jgi:hypothetical protein
MPNCAFGKPQSDYNKYILADYRKHGPKEDQSGESFSDFMAGEILGKILKQEKSLQVKRDSLVAITSTLSRLHGLCLKKNTPDSHPPGFLRMNRIMMSSQEFRESIGCKNGPPKTPSAGVTCPGI